MFPSSPHWYWQRYFTWSKFVCTRELLCVWCCSCTSLTVIIVDYFRQKFTSYSFGFAAGRMLSLTLPYVSKSTSFTHASIKFSFTKLNYLHLNIICYRLRSWERVLVPSARHCWWYKHSMRISSSRTNKNKCSTSWLMMATSWTKRPTSVAMLRP